MTHIFDGPDPVPAVPPCSGCGAAPDEPCRCGGTEYIDDEYPPEPQFCACVCGCSIPVRYEGDKCGMCAEACFMGTWG